MSRLFAAIVSTLVLFSAVDFKAAAQSAPAWSVILDAAKFGEWSKLGDGNWRVEDGVVVADKTSGPAPSFLVSKDKYKDFALRVEFWSSDEANSGVFIRCADPKVILDKNCYEVNIFDRRPDPSYGTGGIVHFAEVNPMPKAGGKWNTMEITAQGRQITVMLNGQKTSELRNTMFPEGPIAVQHGAGVIKFRKIELRPL